MASVRLLQTYVSITLPICQSAVVAAKTLCTCPAWPDQSIGKCFGLCLRHMTMTTQCDPCSQLKLLSCRLRQQATKEGVIQRGLECILLLISMYAAAWNHNSVDRPFLYGSRDGIKRKRDAQYVTQLRKVTSPDNHLAFQWLPD